MNEKVINKNNISFDYLFLIFQLISRIDEHFEKNWKKKKKLINHKKMQQRINLTMQYI